MQHTKFYSFTAHEKQQFHLPSKQLAFTESTLDSCGIVSISQEFFFIKQIGTPT